MIHCIENKELRVCIKEAGAELCSLFHKPSSTERLWQASPLFWDWHAPILFPVVGRCLNDKLYINGSEYAMEKHGFARRNLFTVAAHSPDKIVFQLQQNEITQNLFPYRFTLNISYTLIGNILLQEMSVLNTDTQTFAFSLGGHSAFSTALSGFDKFEDYTLLFEKQEDVNRHFINTDGYFTGEEGLMLQAENTLPLQHSLFETDAIILKNLQSDFVELRCEKHFHYLRLRFRNVTHQHVSFPYLGIWTKPGAPYVCIEPWFGCADTVGRQVDFADREGAVSLQAGGVFNTAFSIEVG